MEADGSAVLTCGMSFGDEGKGGFVDHLADDGGVIIKYNGGAHASHTVISDDGLTHRFAQLGSGMLRPGCVTLLDAGFTADPFALAVESRILAGKLGVAPQAVLDRVAVHEDCLTVTRLHRCLNRLEMEQTHALRGSVGTGVSTAVEIYDSFGVALRFGDIFRGEVGGVLRALQDILRARMGSSPVTLSPRLQAEIASVSGEAQLRRLAEEYERLLDAYDIHRFSDTAARAAGKSVVLEGSQGLLLDRRFGLRPHTTFLDTTAGRGKELFPRCRALGIVKAFSTRHGAGVFPTYDGELSERLDDPNQETGPYNGRIRSGWLDAVLLRYAQRVNGVSGLCLSCLDRLSGIRELSLCVAYDYPGQPGDEFDALFRWRREQGQVRIYDILKVSDASFGYLCRCRPVYMTLPGWDGDISGTEDPAALPVACRRYVEAVERLSGVPVLYVSTTASRRGRIKFR